MRIWLTDFRMCLKAKILDFPHFWLNLKYQINIRHMLNYTNTSATTKDADEYLNRQCIKQCFHSFLTKSDKFLTTFLRTFRRI